MKYSILRSIVIFAITIVVNPTIAAESSYGNYRDRHIKSLSEQEVDDLLAGRGMGLALPAELNSYPGLMMAAHNRRLFSKNDLGTDLRPRARREHCRPPR